MFPAIISLMVDSVVGAGVLFEHVSSLDIVETAGRSLHDVHAKTLNLRMV